ncbi:hypothetical protein VCHE16_1574, partial [Vibrio paracholerae HE-16]
MKKVLV